MCRSEFAQTDWIRHIFSQRNRTDDYLCVHMKGPCGCPRDEGRLNHHDLMTRILEHTKILCDVRSEVSRVQAHTGSR